MGPVVTFATGSRPPGETTQPKTEALVSDALVRGTSPSPKVPLAAAWLPLNAAGAI